MAQELLRMEQQYENTLRLRKTDHDVEINKLLQDLANEREGHHSELQKMLEQWEKQKAETEAEHEKQLMDMKQKVAAMQVQQEEEQTRVRNAKQEQAVAEGERLPWLSEKRLLLQQLECLQRAVASLEHEKMELKQLNAELRRTLEEVERERRRLKRYCRGQSLPGACGCSLSGQHKMPASREEESHAHCSHRLAELQNQVSLLQTQLAQDRRYKEDYVECCAKTSQELSDLHQELCHSLAAVIREPRAAVLAAETEKLGQSLKLHCW
ncbi:centrosome-associated protein CEP250-like isoform X1 [Nyctibius grandis]|uniref:centrosome-associated protein CEP250-like isoform X1 n=1 Tax=Nyctibius grandis TaxID=48427 RepID=UPI0035BBD6B5